MHVKNIKRGSPLLDMIACGHTDTVKAMTYCRVPEGWGIQQTAKPLSCDETWSVNPLVRQKMAHTRHDVLTDYNLIHLIHG